MRAAKINELYTLTGSGSILLEYGVTTTLVVCTNLLSIYLIFTNMMGSTTTTNTPAVAAGQATTNSTQFYHTKTKGQTPFLTEFNYALPLA